MSTSSALHFVANLHLGDAQVPARDDKPLGYQQLDRHGVGTLKAITYRAFLQAAKRKQGPVWDFYEFSRRHTGDRTHARLNTQRKILFTLWSLWLANLEFDPETFSRSQPIDV